MNNINIYCNIYIKKLIVLHKCEICEYLSLYFLNFNFIKFNFSVLKI